MDLLFLQVGGTIDKDYPAGKTDHGNQFEIGEPAYLSIIERVMLVQNWGHRVILRKDSLDMTDADRAEIRARAEQADEEMIVITHGTDTIHLTAAALGSDGHTTEGIGGKTIVLTGSLLPEKFKGSDADFNLGMAVAAAQCLPHGVYIALYGEVKEWSDFKPR